MFTAKLYDFQETHKRNLLCKCADYKELVLSAPTGSGKTVMICSFIDEYLDENPNTVFVWLCPGAGGLEQQSRDTFNEVTTGIPDGDVYDFINESDPRSHVFFINWDKINKKSNVVLKEGEHKDLLTKIYECHKEKIDIFMVIDEEHKFKDTAEEYISLMQPKHVLKVSATVSSSGDYTETITDSEVIACGLISAAISINEGLGEAIEENNKLDDDLTLLELADKKRKEIQKAYDSMGLKIRPLVLIQFPNGNDEWIEKVYDALEQMGYSRNSGLVSSWFSGDHPDNPEEIKKIDGKYAFLLFKQAIATGWDCPRAKILVKLREGGTEQFNIQTIGRIRRMPERKHYGNSLLDNCYLYTLDAQFKDGLTRDINETFYSYLHKKKKSISLALTKRKLNGSDLFAANPEAVVIAIRNRFLKECDIKKDGLLEKHELEVSKGFVFGTKLKASAIQGVARTTHDIKSLNKIFGGEHQIDLHADGFIIRDAKRRIAASIGIDEHITNNAFDVLFAPKKPYSDLLSSPEEREFDEKNKLIEFQSRKEYIAFLVNNKELLIDILKAIEKTEIGEIKEAEIVESEWSIPYSQYYNQHKRIPVTSIFNKNAFEDYGDNIVMKPNRSLPEILFEKWCEANPKVEWYYKNGDKGDDFFSIVYRRTFRRNNFYPDYILRTKKGETWIIEVKGGVSSDNKSENIDSQAPFKFEALKEYGEQFPDVKWGFVRNIDANLYINNTQWDESMINSKNWKPIQEFI